MEINRVKVNIFGQNYTIQGDANPEHIYKLSEYVDGKMNEISKSLNNCNLSQVAILAALNIADEYFQLKEITESADGEVIKRTEALISLLEDGIIGEISPSE